MLASIHSATLLGVEGRPVSVEVHIGQGLPTFTVIGLPDTACREASHRVKAAFASTSLEFPQRRVTVNLAPPDVRKTGSGFDLAIAVGLLVAAGTVSAEATAGCGFVGELGLDGAVRGVRGTVPLVDALVTPTAVVAATAAADAAAIGHHGVRSVSTLAELVAALRGEAPWPDPPPPPALTPPGHGPDLGDVRGQAVARLGLEVAAAGGHHLLMVGPPGSGKTMLARRLPGLLPDLPSHQAVVATRVHSAAGLALPPGGLVRRPPLRAPHHGASSVSIIGGGGGWLRPGEISLAAGGVLFLDELGEFPASVLDALRQPLEEGVVRISRAKASVAFPADFLLVAAMNPCPCGNGGPPGACRCSDAARARYGRRLSGPLLDRFDLRLEVLRPEVRDLMAGPPGETSAEVAARVERARARAAERGVPCNARLPGPSLDELSPLGGRAAVLLEDALRVGSLSARGLHRVRRVAQTLADLAGHDGPLGEDHVGLALQLRAEPSGLGVAA